MFSVTYLTDSNGSIKHYLYLALILPFMVHYYDQVQALPKFSLTDYTLELYQ